MKIFKKILIYTLLTYMFMLCIIFDYYVIKEFCRDFPSFPIFGKLVTLPLLVVVIIFVAGVMPFFAFKYTKGDFSDG